MTPSTLAISFWNAYLAAGSVSNRGFTTIPGDNCSQDDFLVRNVTDMKCEATFRVGGLGLSVHKRANCGDFDSQPDALGSMDTAHSKAQRYRSAEREPHSHRRFHTHLQHDP